MNPDVLTAQFNHFANLVSFTLYSCLFLHLVLKQILDILSFPHKYLSMCL